MYQDMNRDIIAKIIAKLQAVELNSNGGVTDVTVEGSSIVEDGIAKLVKASNNTFGLVKVGSTGITISSAGILILQSATGNQVKIGTQISVPLTPSVQHESAFYGMAKAAGDDTQATSSNAVGTYTDSAIDKILLMLGVSPLIAPHETETAENAYSIGDCFMFDGRLCKATSAIAVSDTIAIGTNCAVTTLMEEIRGN